MSHYLLQAEDMDSIVGHRGEQLFEVSLQGIKIPERDGKVVLHACHDGCPDSRFGQDLFGFRIEMVENKQEFSIRVRPLMNKLAFHVERICHDHDRSQPERRVISYHTLGSIRKHYGYFSSLSHAHLLETVCQPEHMVP